MFQFPAIFAFHYGADRLSGKSPLLLALITKWRAMRVSSGRKGKSSDTDVNMLTETQILLTLRLEFHRQTLFVPRWDPNLSVCCCPDAFVDFDNRSGRVTTTINVVSVRIWWQASHFEPESPNVATIWCFQTLTVIKNRAVPILYFTFRYHADIPALNTTWYRYRFYINTLWMIHTVMTVIVKF